MVGGLGREGEVGSVLTLPHLAFCRDHIGEGRGRVGGGKEKDPPALEGRSQSCSLLCARPSSPHAVSWDVRSRRCFQTGPRVPTGLTPFYTAYISAPFPPPIKRGVETFTARPSSFCLENVVPFSLCWLFPHIRKRGEKRGGKKQGASPQALSDRNRRRIK